jgi:hypothetical protein
MNLLAAKTAAIALAGLALNASAGYVYDNSNPSSDQLQRLEATEGLWFGDEVVLAGSDRFLIGFDFQFWATNTSGLTIDVALHLQDGPEYNGYDSPGTTIYSLSGFNLSDTPRSTLVFDSTDLLGGIDITGYDTLTLAIRFNNIGSGQAGVDLYNPVDIGSSYPDYWQLVGSQWQLTTNNVFPVVNFGMTIEAVPEPSAFALVLLGGLTGLVGRRILRRRA